MHSNNSRRNSSCSSSSSYQRSRPLSVHSVTAKSLRARVPLPPELPPLQLLRAESASQTVLRPRDLGSR